MLSDKMIADLKSQYETAAKDTAIVNVSQIARQFAAGGDLDAQAETEVLSTLISFAEQEHMPVQIDGQNQTDTPGENAGVPAE